MTEIHTPEIDGDPDIAEPRTRVRTGSRDTSIAAADALTNGSLAALQLFIYEELEAYGPQTDDELRERCARHFGAASKSGPATRRGELTRAGWVLPLLDDDGKTVKRPSDAGNPMTVWRAVPPEEWAKPPEPEPAPEYDPAGMAAARALAAWELGEARWAARIIRAYLHPAETMAELEEEMDE